MEISKKHTLWIERVFFIIGARREHEVPVTHTILTQF